MKMRKIVMMATLTAMVITMSACALDEELLTKTISNALEDYIENSSEASVQSDVSENTATVSKVEEPEVFADEYSKQAAGIIDASINSAVEALKRVDHSGQTKVTESAVGYPFEKDESLRADKFTGSRLELFDKLLGFGNGYEGFRIAEKEYSGDLVMDVLTLTTYLERYDPRLNCFFTIDFAGNDAVDLFFNPHEDANSGVSVDTAEIEIVKEEMKVFDAVIDRVVEKMPEGLSTYDKYYYLAAVVAYQCDYPTDGALGGSRATAFGALIDGEAICEGYAKAFYLLCKRADLSCYIVNGMAGSVGHMWNLVTLESGTLNVDVTWCDEYEPGDYAFTFSFGETAVESETSGHTPDEGCRIATAPSLWED